MLVTGNLVSTEWKVGSRLKSYINTKDHKTRLPCFGSDILLCCGYYDGGIFFFFFSGRGGGINTRHLVKPVTWQRGNQMPLEGEGCSVFDGRSENARTQVNT